MFFLFCELLSEICTLVSGEVSVEVISTEAEDIVEEGLRLSKISSNVVVKIPMTYEGVSACTVLARKHGIRVNITLCFSVSQAILAAKSGAYFISPFVGRIDDLGGDGLGLIRDIRTVYSNYGFATKILAASIRSPQHVVEVAKSGADIATLPVKVFRQLFSHPLTDLGLSCVMDCIVNCGWEFAVGYIKLLSGYSMTDMRSWAVA